VFVKPAGGWSGPLTQNAKLTASDGASGDEFGFSAAVSGDTVVVGAHHSSVSSEPQGSAYVFVKPVGGWSGALTQDAKLTASDGGGTFNLFGESVAVRGNLVVVGARRDDIGSNPDQGSAYEFVKPAGGWSGTLTEDAKLTASDGAGNDQFGNSAAISGDTIVVGAFQDDIGANVNRGSAYVFVALDTPALLVLTPETATNPLETSHTVTAIVENAYDQPVEDVIVRYTVTGSVTASGQCTTAADGRCAFTYQGPTAPGSDTITAFADTDADGVQDSGEPSGSAAKTWVSAAPATVVLTPATDVNPAGTSHTVTATVTDASGNPVPGVTVPFTVSGAHSAVGIQTTDAAGQATFSYMGTLAGVDAIAAYADADQDGSHDPEEPAGAAGKLWVAGPPATITVTPPTDTNPVGSQHCVTATVADAFGNAASGVTVRFTVTGAINTSGAVATDANGQATFCYTGPELPGADSIIAHADTDGDGTVDAGEPVGGATKTWLLPEATPGQVTGGGHAPAPSGTGEIAFGFNAKSTDGVPKGNCNVVDQAADVHIKCLDVTSLVRDGTHATIFGQGTINEAAIAYRIDVDDLDEPGAGHDTFTILTDSGYTAGGILSGGNIQIK
jgi:hypothetical protein